MFLACAAAKPAQTRRYLAIPELFARLRHCKSLFPRDAETSTRDARATQDISLETLINFIDWSPFFHTWELRGRYPAILDDATFGKQARELFDDAQRLLTKIAEEKLVQARGVIGFWPANAVGDDVELFTDDSRSIRLTTLHFLRQQMRKPSGQFNLCLADYVAPKTQPDGGHRPSLQDYIGGFAVTGGIGADEVAAEFKAAHDDYTAIIKCPPTCARGVGIWAQRKPGAGGFASKDIAEFDPPPVIRRVPIIRRNVRCSVCSRRRKTAASSSRNRSRCIQVRV